jgi:hypothetical protein
MSEKIFRRSSSEPVAAGADGGRQTGCDGRGGRDERLSSVLRLTQATPARKCAGMGISPPTGRFAGGPKV